MDTGRIPSLPQMISRASFVRALLIPCAMTLVLAGCSTAKQSAVTGARVRIPSVCMKFAAASEQQKCAGRWQVAQEECKRDEAALKANPTTPTQMNKKFSLSKCITKKMNLAASTRSQRADMGQPAGVPPTTRPTTNSR